jgi:hypothetical protein
MNSTFIGSSNNYPFLLSFIPAEIKSITQRNTLKIVATDSVYNKSEVKTDFDLKD